MNPVNHASYESLVVPVFPAAGLPSFPAGPPVPSRTTPRIRSVMIQPVSALITCTPGSYSRA